MSTVTSTMMVLMILFMAVLMAIFMIAIHSMRSHRHQQRGRGIISLINWGIGTLLRLGVRITLLGQVRLLTVRGRKTGKSRTLPVDLYGREGRRFLIATHGEGNWVHNLRAASEGILSLGRKRQAFTAVELPPEAAGPVIKEVLGSLLASQGMRGSVLRQHLGVTPDSSLDDFIHAARSHPVFELSSAGALSSWRL